MNESISEEQILGIAQRDARRLAYRFGLSDERPVVPFKTVISSLPVNIRSGYQRFVEDYKKMEKSLERRLRIYTSLAGRNPRWKIFVVAMWCRTIQVRIVEEVTLNGDCGVTGSTVPCEGTGLGSNPNILPNCLTQYLLCLPTNN